jgi:hypothetical protein
MVAADGDGANSRDVVVALCSLAERCRLEAKSEKGKSGAKSADALTRFVNTGGTNVKIAKNVAIMVPSLQEQVMLCCSYIEILSKEQQDW